MLVFYVPMLVHYITIEFTSGTFHHVGIENLVVLRENTSAHVISADTFVNSFIKLTGGYSLDQIFNCDEIL